jgi:hypothetical protein
MAFSFKKKMTSEIGLSSLNLMKLVSDICKPFLGGAVTVNDHSKNVLVHFLLKNFFI